MNVFLDTNIVLRYLVHDNEPMFDICRQLFQNIEKGLIRPYISTVVLLEVYWVMISTYHVSKAKAQLYIHMVLEMRGLVIVEKTDFSTAFRLHKKTGVKLTDCLIATQIPPNVTLVTYDKEFGKIRGLLVTTPEEVIKT